jgi:hypothetical protein
MYRLFLQKQRQIKQGREELTDEIFAVGAGVYTGPDRK